MVSGNPVIHRGYPSEPRGRRSAGAACRSCGLTLRPPTAKQSDEAGRQEIFFLSCSRGAPKPRHSTPIRRA